MCMSNGTIFTYSVFAQTACIIIMVSIKEIKRYQIKIVDAYNCMLKSEYS